LGEIAGQRFLGRFDLAFGHLELAATLAAKFVINFQPDSGALNNSFTLYFGETGHDVKEKSAVRRASIDGIGHRPDCQGADEPSNMQWQTVADAKVKDKWEREGCGK
jgi:hypothetical protein